MADTGWLNAGTIETIAIDSKPDWEYPIRAQTQNDFDSYSEISTGDYTDYLRATNFSVDIPAGATIDGIEVRYDKWRAGGGFGEEIRDNHIYLVKSGSVIGGCTDKADTSTNWPTSDTDTYTNYGAAADLWNCNLTESDVEDSTFGVELSAQCVGGFLTAASRVDHVQIKVYYTEAGPEDVYSGKGIGRGINRGVMR